MTIITDTKDPDDQEWYSLDWSEYIPDTDAISTVSWSIEGPDTALTNLLDTSTDYTASIKLGGGTEGITYRCVCRITTVNGAVKDRSLFVEILEE